ncbi:MAG: peptidoglycan-binding protein, partial [Lachnospiraceae bacterium]|nr:peptidoglycan-binding protein [Lachnospiraceae bacterium]
MDINNQPTYGELRISVISSAALIPIAGATVTIAYTENPTDPVYVDTTDSSGETEVIRLTAPNFELSQAPSEIQPYTDYNITVEAEGYEPVLVSGTELLPDRRALQLIRMNPLAATEAEEIVVIPVHTLFGEYPPKIPEDEIKPMAESGEIVLSRVVIPEYVIVHDGVPSDSTAPNYWVRYKDYIKNVASCEIYATWPEASLYANILAIMSFTLNRVYTEWYRNQGYDFTITSSTAYDQKWIYGRNIYENIDVLVDNVFANFLSRPGVR